MTTMQQQRCQHCGIQYTYYPSGYSAKHNSKTYCPDCEAARAKAVQEAFSKIPIQYVKEWVNTDLIEFQKLYDIRQKRMKEKESWIERAFAPIFNLDTGECSIDVIVTHEGKAYRLNWWPNQLDEGKVLVEEWVPYDEKEHWWMKPKVEE